MTSPLACDQCGNPLEPADQFCAGCGHPVGAAPAADPEPNPVPGGLRQTGAHAFLKTCPGCGIEVLPGDRACPSCGRELPIG